MFLLDSAGGFHVVILAGAVISAIAVSSAKHYFQQTFVQFGSAPASCGLTGATAARRLLTSVGLNAVEVVRSNAVDCYEPRKRQVQLRDQSFNGKSLAALAVAAHEVGHAEQFATGFWPARLRLWMRSIYFSLLLVMAGALVLALVLLPGLSIGLVVLGVGLVMLVVQVPTVLPLEYDASRRAKRLVAREGLLAPFEESSVDRLLDSASRTYLAWECQRWLVFLAIGAGLFWFAPGWSADSGEYAPIQEVVVAPHPVVGAAEPEPLPEVSLNLELPMLSTMAMLVPAVLLTIVAAKFVKSSGRRPTALETAITRNNAGLDLLRQGDRAAALEAFSSALAIDPKLHAAYVNRGHCRLLQGHYDLAMADVEESLRLNPSFVEGLALRGQIWAERAQHDLALADYQRALEMSPRNTAALTCRGQLFLAKGDHDRALADFEQAIGYAPDEGQVYLGRATIAMIRGDIDAALADCSQALAFGADAGSACGMRGHIWFQKRDYDRAITDFTTAVKHGHDSAMQYCNRGLAFYFKGNHAAAIADCDKAIELDPTGAVAFNNRGAARAKLGEYAAAVADLQKSLVLQPEFPNPHRHLAWLKATCPVPVYRDGAGAVSHAHLAKHLVEEIPAEFHALLAVAYAEAGDFAKAVECQTRCVELSRPDEQPKMRERLALFESKQPFRETSSLADGTGVRSRRDFGNEESRL